MKGVVCGIIVLFVGTSLIPGISGDVEHKNDITQVNEPRSAPSFTTDWWPMFRHDPTHSGYSTSTAPETNTSLWNYTTGDLVLSSPAVANGKVYIGSDDLKVYCLNAETGEWIWDYTTGNNVRSSPAVADGKVYIGSWDYKVYCFDANTGVEIWNYTTDSWVISSPAIADGKVYIGSYDGKIYCLNANSGIQLWNYTTNDQVLSSPAIVNGKVYIGSDDSNIYCLNATTGGKIWNYSYAAGYRVRTSPAVINDRLYACVGGQIFCLNANNGSFYWSFNIGTAIDCSPAVAYGKVYFCSSDWGKVYCLNATTGMKIWNYTINSLTDWSSPAVADGKVYIGSESKMYCLNANTGTKIWDDAIPIDCSAAIANGNIYIGSWNHKVYCFGPIGNQPPNVPSNPWPDNHEINVPVTTKLIWSGGDPDGDPVTYDIYLGNVNPPPKVVSNQTGLTYDPPGNLNAYTKYYWKIVAWDNSGASSIGPVWDFTTGHPPMGDLSITNTHLVQVLDDPDEFIINKKAVACVNISSSIPYEVYVDMKITYNFGLTYYVDNGPGGPGAHGVPLQQGWNRVYLPGGPVIHQSGDITEKWMQPNGGRWLRWTQKGIDNNIRVFVDCSYEEPETNEDNNEYIGSGTFVDSNNLRILVVPVYFPQANPPVGNNKPFSVNMGDQQGFLLDLFPVAEDRFSYQIQNARAFYGNPFTWNNSEWFSNLIIPLVNDVKAMNYQRVVIVLHSDWEEILGLAGIAIGMQDIGNESIREPVIVINKWYNGSVVAHEIGHTYFLWHPHDIGPFVNDSYRYDVRNRIYERYERTHMSYWNNTRVYHPEIPWDTCWIDKGRYNSNPDENRPYYSWMYRSCNLFDQFKKSNVNLGTKTQEVIVIGGIINDDNTAVGIEPWYHTMNGEPDLYPSNIGDYFIVLLDSQHNILCKSGFNLSFIYWKEDENGYPIPLYSNSSAFVYAIPYVSGTRYIELWDANDTVILNKTVSPHTPTVEITFPIGGETFWIGDEINIEWNAEDLDGDPLLYIISYSQDGIEWNTVDWRLTQNQYIWNTTGVPPGRNYRIRVMACDGINTGFDISDGIFSLMNEPPSIPTISGPMSGWNTKQYQYNFNATDIEGHDIYYYIDWGDDFLEENVGPYLPDQLAKINHSWEKPGNYLIKVKVNDTYNESEWSELFPVYIVNESNLSRSFLLGLITDQVVDPDFIILKPKILLYMNLKPFDIKLLQSNAVILIEKTNNGILLQQFIFGLFNTAIVSESSLSTVHPFGYRLKNLITSNP